MRPDPLAEEIHGERIECGFRFKTITVKVRYEHFDTFTRARSLSFSTNDLDILRNNGKRLVDQFLRKKKKVRLVGLRVSALSRVYSNARQGPLLLTSPYPAAPLSPERHLG